MRPIYGASKNGDVSERVRVDAEIGRTRSVNRGDRADEGFGHSIALWAFDWRGSRFEADVASEAACLAGEVTAAIVGQPLDGDPAGD
jgi:hypothetical protein